MKKKIPTLKFIKKIKNNKLSLNLNTLSVEKRLERIGDDLKEMLEKSSFEQGEILSSSQLKQTSSFRENIQENFKSHLIEKFILRKK